MAVISADLAACGRALVEGRVDSSRRHRVIVAGFALVWVLVSLGLPLLQLAAAGLSEGGPPTAPGVFVAAGLRGLLLALAVAVVAVVAAYPTARTASPGLLLMLVLVAPLARALGVLGLGLAPGGLAVWLAQSAGAIPLAALVVQLRLRGRPKAWLEAAADLGAGPWRRWWSIELPVVAPALALAGGWAALWSLGDVTTLELAGGGKVYTLALLLRDAVLSEANPRRSAVIVGVLLAVALPCALAIARGVAGLMGEVTAGGPAARGWLRVAGWCGVAIAGLPLLGLVRHLSFVTDGTSEPLLRGLLARSVVLTLGCGLAAAGLGFLLALARRPRGRGDVIAGLVLLPLAVPPVVYGALMVAAGRGLGVRPGYVLTFVALLPELVALAYAGAVLAVAAVQREVVDAARDLGAGPAARLLRVWWPLLAPAGLAVTLVGFARGLAEASVPAFTSGPGGGTLAVGMAIVARGGEVGVVPRWALGLSLVPVALVWISRWAWRRRARDGRRW